MFLQYYMHWQREWINNLIEEAILEADEKGVKVMSLGLLNQASRSTSFFYSCFLSLGLNEEANLYSVRTSASGRGA